MKLSQILETAARLIEPEGAWLQGSAATTADGTPVDPKHEQAKCFCIVGALEHAANRPLIHLDPVLDPVRDVVGDRALAPWNDLRGRTQAEVVAVLREAARRAA